MSDGNELTAAGPAAEIFERGYRAYTGERTGVQGAMRSVFFASVQRALGLRRKFRFKVVPLLTVTLAYLPAIGFIAFAILLPEEIASEVVADYAGYYGIINIAMLLFIAFVAPELLSSDRQTGMLGLYLASPLTKNLYLAAKAAALFAVLLLVTLFPLIFILIGYTISGLGPDGLVATLKLLAKMLVAGSAMASYFSIIGMAISTLTPRRGFASAAIVVFLVASTVLTGVLAEQGATGAWIELFGFMRLPFDVVARIYDDPLEQIAGVSGLASFATWAGVCAVGLAIIVEGYRRLPVTK